MKSDIEINKECDKKNIIDIAKKIGLDENDLELYGKYKAKIIKNINYKNNNSKLVLVSSINPTKEGEGKTTVAIGLADSLNNIGKKTIVELREPSMGPTLGLKGGATGGGYAQVYPMDEINFHFTGDIHAITSANNAISCFIDNHIYYGNELNIDIENIYWRRCLDLSDRPLRDVMINYGRNGQRLEHFDISVASEIMAVICLSKDYTDLERRISNIVVAKDINGKYIKLEDLGITGCIAAILKDTIKPNLVQTLEGTPAIIHGGPFANIAHGCSSVIASRYGLMLSEYVITEAGFGADLGAEKFLDIKVPVLSKDPNLVVLVVTAKALNAHSEDGNIYNGLDNLKKHIENIKEYNLNVIVTINEYEDDNKEDIKKIIEFCSDNNVKAVSNSVWKNGSAGGLNLAKLVVEECEEKSGVKKVVPFKTIYEKEDEIEEKIRKVVTKIYGGNGVIYSKKAEEKIKKLEKSDYRKYPICIAKTPMSLSDNPKLLGRPTDFKINVSDISLKAGAEFIVVYTSKILTMPGLPEKPNMLNITLDGNGEIKGLF